MEQWSVFVSRIVLIVFAYGGVLFIVALMLNHVYSKNYKNTVDSGLTGSEVAERILHSCKLLYSDLANVRVESIKGLMENNYCPHKKAIQLDEELFDHSSITAIGIASHQCGHVIQDAEKIWIYRVYSKLFPVAKYIKIGFFVMLFLGMIALGPNVPLPSRVFFAISIFCLLSVAFFYVLMLPMEFNASKRALSVLKDGMYLSDQEIGQVKKVLFASAMYELINNLLFEYASLDRRRVIKYKY